jgi:hypothetical protein
MERKKYNILLAPGGSIIAQEIYYALRDHKDVNLFSINLRNFPSVAPFIFKNCNSMTYFEDMKQVINDINKACKKHKIDYIFPCNDEACLVLSGQRNNLSAKVLTSSFDTNVKCRFKNYVYDFFTDCVPVPKVYEHKPIKYPVFIKPNIGTGSKDCHIIDNEKEFDFYFNQMYDNHIVTEYLPGDEYTVDCFSDRNDGLLYCNPRKRIRTASGVAANCKKSNKQVANTLTQYAKNINSFMPFYGTWFFQVKADKEGVFKITDIASRVAGAMSYSRVAGVNFPLLSIYEAERIPIEIMTNNFNYDMEKCFINKYNAKIKYDNVYVDLDDTLIVKEKVNTRLIAFLYQCFNEHKPIRLLTKHSKRVLQTLYQYQIKDSLFEEIFVIPLNANKADYIKEPNSILIDDSFSERYPVHQKGIPTFDLSMLEILINERV